VTAGSPQHQGDHGRDGHSRRAPNVPSTG
jgi:hypothetical protein